jgi:Ca2+/Na+ antiporter
MAKSQVVFFTHSHSHTHIYIIILLIIYILYLYFYIYTNRHVPVIDGEEQVVLLRLIKRHGVPRQELWPAHALVQLCSMWMGRV